MGLYDDEKEAVTSGDVLDVIYWQTKFATLKFEQALKTHQPEGAIRLLVPDVINSCASVLETFPNHEDVKNWRLRALEIEKKIDPNAPSADFKSNFAQWRDYSYEAGWRSYHIAKMAAEDEDWALARTHALEVDTQFKRTVERMGAWPAEVQAWVRESLQEMQGMAEKAAGKL